MRKTVAGLSAGIFAAAFIAMVGVTSPASAEPTAEHLALATKVITLTRADSGLDQIIPAIVDDAKTLFIRSNPDLAKDISEVADKIGEDMKARRSELEKAISVIYAEAFTADELKAIATFYESAPGAKLANTVNGLALKTLEAGRDWGDKLSGEMVAGVRAEMLKRGHNL
ncbi:MAG: DUF2059 domain-containing protein [Hyphomicrobiales bacterium]